MKGQNMNTTKAEEWIRTEEQAVRRDVARLGLEAAVEYEMDLIADREAMGDTRWTGITHEEMRAALAGLARAEGGE